MQVAGRGAATRGDTVLFVTHVGYFGGSAVSLRTVLRHLDRGLGRVLAAPDGGPVAAALIDEHLVGDHVPLPWATGRGLRSAAAVVATARLIATTIRRRRRLVAIHANGLIDALLAAPAAAIARVPLVVWVHETDAAARRSYRLAVLAARAAPRVEWAAVSDALARELRTTRWMKGARVHVVPNPIEATRRTGETTSGVILRVGYLGTDTLVKGFDLLPEVARRLADRQDMRLLVFARRHHGIPPAIERVWHELDELSPGAVELRGKAQDVGAAYADCDIVLCPSRAESFSRVAAEAMTEGLPVVAADIPAVREVVGDAGILFPRGDTAAAARALGRLADEPALRRRLASAGRERARAFDPSGISRRLEELYLRQ
ncbi:MAG: glycosyltransferase family 4 protein [Actinomycetota bacterium]